MTLTLQDHRSIQLRVFYQRRAHLDARESEIKKEAREQEDYTQGQWLELQAVRIEQEHVDRHIAAIHAGDLDD